MSTVEYLGATKSLNQCLPLVSVCVITYQHAAFIRECLDGILAQETSFPIEILVGEDQSSDGTREICIAYADRHPNQIRLFLRDQSDNISIDGRPTGTANLLHLFGQARGDFIAICEGDDYWTDPSKLERQATAMREHPECSLVFHNALLIGPGERRPFNKGLVEGYYGIERVILDDLVAVPPQSMFFRKSLLELDPWLKHVWALDYAIHLALAARQPFYFLDREMSVYRVHPGGVSRNHVRFYQEVKLMEILCLFNASSGFRYDDLVKQRLEEFRKWMAKQVPTKAPTLAARVRAWARRRLPARFR